MRRAIDIGGTFERFEPEQLLYVTHKTSESTELRSFFNLKIMRRALRAAGANRWLPESRHMAQSASALFPCRPASPVLAVRAV